MQIFFYEAFEEEADALRQALPGEFKAGFTWMTPQEAGHRSPPARLVSIRTQSHIPPHWAHALDGILSRSTGFDHLTRLLARFETPVLCAHLPLYCHRAVAEQALLLWMALLRKLPRQTAQMTRFQRDSLTGQECAGKTLFVVGVGHIGSEIVKIGQALGMRVLGHDKIHKHDFVDYTDLESALAVADIVVCAMNLTDENNGYFDRHVLAKTKPGSLFINIARGELAPTADVLALLESGHLGGVGLDVFEDEGAIAVAWREGRKTAASQTLRALKDHPRAICTPHNAFNTIEAVRRKSEHSVLQIRHFLDHGRWLWPIPTQSK